MVLDDRSDAIKKQTVKEGSGRSARQVLKEGRSTLREWK
jgi:hypothetical protein